MKYTNKLRDEIAAWISEHGLVEYHGAKLREFCEQFAIDSQTHYRWLESRTDYKDAVEKAKQIFKDLQSDVLVTSLFEAAKGGYHESVDTDYVPDETGKPQIKLQRKKKIFAAPNVGAAIFLLTNIDPDHYKQRQTNDVVLKKSEEKELTEEELNEQIGILEKQLGKVSQETQESTQDRSNTEE